MARLLRVAAVLSALAPPAVVLAIEASTVAAAAPPTLVPLIGAWTGAGSIRLEGGQTETVKCKAYYTDRGANVGVALRCASSGAKIDLRATLEATGGKIGGSWEERQFNAAGSLTGAAVGNRLSLDLDGGGFKASVVVSTAATSQTLTISAQNGGFKSVTIAFARD
jgi:hypothetical protein